MSDEFKNLNLKYICTICTQKDKEAEKLNDLINTLGVMVKNNHEQVGNLNQDLEVSNKYLQNETNKVIDLEKMLKEKVGTITMDYISQGLDIHYQSKIESLEKRLALAVEGLTFYGEITNWKYPNNTLSTYMRFIDMSDVEIVGKLRVAGQKAREILAVIK